MLGFLSKIFGTSSDSDIDKDLKNSYIPLLQSTLGMNDSQSQSSFQSILKLVKEESKREKTSSLPSGDFILENEKTNPSFQKFLDGKRKNGIGDEDIKWWWNLHDLERRMIIYIDQLNQLTVFNKYHEERKMTPEESIQLVRKYNPFYGDPDDTINITGDNRPIPWELKNRVDIYIAKRSKTDNDNFRKELDKSMSFNSLIRDEISKGKL